MRKVGGKVKPIERFDCETLCSSRGEWVDKERSRRGCTRVDLPPVPWDVEAKAIHRAGWMGRDPVRESTQCGVTINPRMPTEDPREGCPGGWYRSNTIASLSPYLRRRDSHGGRVPNPMLDRTDDEVLLQLAMLFEEYSERWEAQMLRQVSNDG